MLWVFLVLVPLFFLTCCCRSCQGSCVTQGQLSVECATDAAEQYIPAGGPSGVSSGDLECCDLPNQIGHTSDCLWSITQNGCDWELEIDGANTEFRQIIDAYHTIIWKPVGTYDPLCPALFAVDAMSSTFPEDCSYNLDLCISPLNVCCDGDPARTEKMPTTLYARLTYCFGGDENLTIDFQLTWNALTETWDGVAEDAGNGDLTVSLTCVCVGFQTSGCGETGNLCYELTFDHDGCATGSGATIPQDGCDCNPFELLFTLSDPGNLCCEAEIASPWLLEIQEDAFV